VVDRDEPSSTVTVRRASGRDGLWTARRVADHYAVTRDFVYEHANELAGIRLGSGPRPRLRFDPATVRERWTHVDAPSGVPGTRGRPAAKRRERVRPVDLIPIKGDL
jgi:hypothetical protein